MYRWLVVLALLSGLGITGYVSHQGVKDGSVTVMEDGSGFPTPRPR